MPTPTCLNLRELFGKRFKVVYEESYYADRGQVARAVDHWLMIVPCRYGHLYPFGGNMLAASVDGHPNVAGVLRRLPCCRVWQDGDFGELTVIFDVGDFAKVARILQPRRRRQVNLTPEQREAIGRRLRQGWERSSQAIVEPHPTAHGCEVAGQDGQGHRQPQGGLFGALESP